MRTIIKLIVFGVVMLIASCGKAPVSMHSNPEETSVARRQQLTGKNGVYYWKTIFRLNDWEKEFLSRHQLGNLYIRLFDVDWDKEKGMPVPIATTRFMDSIPEAASVVPVVYITSSGLKGIEAYDTLFYRRITAMAKRNGFADKVLEIQLDCDWTKSNQSEYFSFCERTRKLAKADGISLSATIRLHQLSSEAPPVDRGVLMLYNTGSLYNPDTENSILDANDVKPYLSRHIDYDLPLAVAFPTYSWAILMKEGKFSSILHKSDFSDRLLYRECGGNIFEVVESHYLENHYLRVGDKIRVEHSSISEIKKVKGYVENAFGKPMDCIAYHLDSLNLSKYSESDIQTILK